MLSIFKDIAHTPAPSGCENEICKKIKGYFEGYDYFTDTHGTLIVHKKGEGNGTVVLVAMDTPCLYVTYPEKGFARFSPVGGLKPEEGMAILCQGGKTGILGKDEKGMFLDTGVFETEIGSWGVPKPSFYEIDADKIAGANIGQYAAITSVISAAKTATKKEAYFVFATKSQIRQLSPTFMTRIKADKLISVDVSSANDAPAEKTVFASLGNGVCIRVKDEGMLSSKRLIAQLDDAPCKTYREVSTLRGVGGYVQKAYGGIESVGLGIPVRYKGAACEMVSISDIDAAIKVLQFALS